jgi:hypothetical protein
MLGYISRVHGNNKLKDETTSCYFLLSITKMHIKAGKVKEEIKMKEKNEIYISNGFGISNTNQCRIPQLYTLLDFQNI